MKIIKKNYEHYVNDNIDIKVDLNSNIKYNFYIVYYINCLVNSNYMDWLHNQIKMVNNYNAKIYIIATIKKINEKKFKKKVLSIYPNVKIKCTYKNEYEYPGIFKVWKLGKKHNKRNDIILYFHSKGVTRNKEYKYNKNDNYNIILKNIDLIKEIYTIFPKIDKIGYSSGGMGWIWYNFWFARGSYIYNLEKPIKTKRRYYYEDWLGRYVKDKKEKNCKIERPFLFYKNTLDSCYGFFTDKINYGNIGSYYCPNKNKQINR
jgi:hypothetical protein